MARPQVCAFDVLSIMTPRLEKKTPQKMVYAATIYVIQSLVTRFRLQVKFLYVQWIQVTPKPR